MNDQVSWHPSLVKKFSSSNHFKLLNQLRNEVIKYPLNNKKPSAPINETNQDKKNNSNISHPQKVPFAKKITQTKESNTNTSTVSFNNAKNFSIYNNMSNIDSVKKNESFTNDHEESTEAASSQTFKDRLNAIDMK